MDPVSAAVAETMTQAALEPVLRATRRAMGRSRKRHLDLTEGLREHLNRDQLSLGAASLLPGLPPGLTVREVTNVIGQPDFQAAAMQLVAVRLLEDPNLSSVVAQSMTRVFRRSFGSRLTDNQARQQASLTTSSPLLLAADLDAYVETRVARRCDDLARVVAERFRASLATPDDAMRWAYEATARLIAQSATPYLDNLAALPADPAAVDGWLDDYKRSYAAVHSQIELPDLSRRRRVGINDLFVLPAFTAGSEQGVPWEHLQAQRAVILGDPGAGKSTASSQLSLRDWDLGSVPFYVVLRHVRLDRGGFSVLDEVARQLRSRYQIEINVAVVKQLLGDGRAVMYFDGLDELPTGPDRIETTASVETFTKQYPLCRVYVTSRIVGYQGNALQEEFFDTAVILPFDRARIERYVRNWFGFAESLTSEQQDELVDHFMRQSSTIEDLRSNPLLLAYICILYRGKEFIPQNRADLFRMCAELLLKEWDLRRRIIDDLLDLKLAHRALSAVAYHILAQRGGAVGLTEEALLAIAADYLTEQEGVPRRLSASAAAEIVRQCQNRGWIFTNVGTDRRYTERWDFTHQSFREYYGARYLHRHGGPAGRLAPLLAENLLFGRWEVLTQLVLQFREEGVAGQSTELLTDLLRIAEADASDSLIEYLAETARLLSLPRSTVFELTQRCLVAASERKSRSIAVVLQPDSRHAEHVRAVLPDLIGAWAEALAAGRSDVTVGQIWLLTHLSSLGELGLDDPLLGLCRARYPDALPAAVVRLLGSRPGSDTAPAMALDAAVATHLSLCYGARLEDVTDARLTAVSVLFEALSTTAAVGPLSTADWLVNSMSRLPAPHGCRREAVDTLRQLGHAMLGNRVPAAHAFPHVLEERLPAAGPGRAGDDLDSIVARAVGYGEAVALGLMTVLCSWSALHGAVDRELVELLERLHRGGYLSDQGRSSTAPMLEPGWWSPDATRLS